MSSPEERERLAQAQQQIGLHREVYEAYRARWQAAQAEWQRHVTMRSAERPPDYVARLAKAKMAVDNAMKDWAVRGRKAQYERAEAIIADLASRPDTDSSEEKQ